MRTHLTYRHLEPTESIREIVMNKTEQLKRYLAADAEIRWTCSVEPYGHTATAKVFSRGRVFRAHSTRSSLYKTFDSVIRKLKAQMRVK